jgi:cellulose synthase/poly-beta-1,6-N-acetylglucosamine synthase-like glycosyltransferase
VRSLLASDGAEESAVYVVADNCTDNTALVAAGSGAHVLVRTDPVDKGKGYALQLGFRYAVENGADGVLVVDADSVVSKNLVPIVRRYLEAGEEAVQCRYRVMSPDRSIRNRLMDLALLGFNVLRPLGRDRLGLSAGILGNGFALSARALRTVPYRAESIVEDLEYHIHLLRAGCRVRFANDATVYGEMPGGGEAAANQRSRWEGGRLRMLLEWAPRLTSDVASGRMNSLEALLELLTLPLAFQASLLTLLILVAPMFLKQLALGQMTVIGLYVIASASLGEGFPGNMASLAAAPFYVMWKLALLPRIVRDSRPATHWVRTDRRN